MQGQRALGWGGLVVGGVLLLIGILWGHAGFYESQAPILLLLVVGGGVLVFISSRLLRKPKQTVEPVEWRRPSNDEH